MARQNLPLAATSPPAGIRPPAPPFEILQSDQLIDRVAGDGTALAWLMPDQLHVGA
jgi:hypothetical protein